jgi:hypothetical protein
MEWHDELLRFFEENEYRLMAADPNITTGIRISLFIPSRGEETWNSYRMSRLLMEQLPDHLHARMAFAKPDPWVRMYFEALEGAT